MLVRHVSYTADNDRYRIPEWGHRRTGQGGWDAGGASPPHWKVGPEIFNDLDWKRYIFHGVYVLVL